MRFGGSAGRVAFNTCIQYVQLVLNVLIGLFSVRIVLDALGASDYGLYGLIGGIVSLLSFINSSLSQTSIRFISHSMGSQNLVLIKKSFSSCFQLHVVIGFGLVLSLEFVGLFLFNGFLKIEPDRVDTAKILYHLMVFSLLLTTIQTPLKALIISREKFVYTSLIGIFNSVCKLGVAIVLKYVSGDKLLFYGILLAIITVLDFLFYLCYNFVNNRKILSFKWERLSSLSNVASFAGWTLLDVLGTVLNRQGYAVMLNVFFGTVINAAYSVANQIACHLYDISASIINSMKPQIMKSQGAGNNKRMIRLSMTAGKMGFSMMSILAIPFIILMPEILNVWLKEVPEWTCLFARLLIIACLGEQLTRGLVYANQAIGNIKWFSIIVSSIRMLALPVSWLFLFLGFSAYWSIIIFVIFESLGSISRLFVMKRLAGLRIYDFLKSVVGQIVLPFFLSFSVCFVLKNVSHELIWLAFSCVVSALTYMVSMYLIGLTSEEKKALNTIVVSMKSRFLKQE